MKFLITYHDVIEAETKEDAQQKLLNVLKSDVDHKDVDSFKITNLDDYEQGDIQMSKEKTWININEMPVWAEAILEIEGLVNEEVSKLKKADNIKMATLLTNSLTVIKRGY